MAFFHPRLFSWLSTTFDSQTYNWRPPGVPDGLGLPPGDERVDAQPDVLLEELPLGGGELAGVLQVPWEYSQVIINLILSITLIINYYYPIITII